MTMRDFLNGKITGSRSDTFFKFESRQTYPSDIQNPEALRRYNSWDALVIKSLRFQLSLKAALTYKYFNAGYWQQQEYTGPFLLENNISYGAQRGTALWGSFLLSTKSGLSCRDISMSPQYLLPLHRLSLIVNKDVRTAKEQVIMPKNLYRNNKLIKFG